MNYTDSMDKGPYYAQHGEDRILHQIFGSEYKGTAVEVGGFDGIKLSNTYFFERKGWKTVIVEPIPKLVAKIRSQRSCTVMPYAASGTTGSLNFSMFEGVEELSSADPSQEHVQRAKAEGAVVVNIEVQAKRLDDILDEAGIEKLDFLTIDVEGFELSVLEGFTPDKLKPKIIIVEDNTNGASSDIRNWMKAHGYILVEITGCNQWYTYADVDNSEIQRLLKRAQTHVPLVLLQKFVLRNIPSSVKRLIKKTLHLNPLL